jgi:hypothetical protein
MCVLQNHIQSICYKYTTINSWQLETCILQQGSMVLVGVE